MTKTELKELNNLLKEIPTDKRQTVRRTIDKNISFEDAKTIIYAFLPPTTENNQVLTDNDINNSNIQDIPQNNVLERVQDSGNLDIQDLTTKINAVIDNFLEINDITDLKKEPQRVFSALSMYIGNTVFKGTDILKDKSNFNNNSATLTNCNRYDISKLVTMLNYYVYLCTIYNKAFTLDGGAYFLGVSDNYLSENREKLTRAGFDPRKKSEETISASILDNKQCVGSIAYLNHVFGWTTGTTHTEKKETIVIYPTLTNTATQNTITER